MKKPSQPFTFLKTGIFPRSIGRTFKKIFRDISPNADQEFIKKYQISRQRTTIAVKFLLLLIIVPLLTHQLSKRIFILPLVEKMRTENSHLIFLNQEMKGGGLLVSRVGSCWRGPGFDFCIHQ